MSSSKPELSTSWGYGRPVRPSLSNEVLSWRLVPWKVIYALTAGVPALIVFSLFGFSNALPWLILFPILCLLFALPSLAAVLVPWSYFHSPSGSGNPEKYFTFKDKTLQAEWKGKKVPIQSLYEAFFDGKLDLNIDAETGKPYDLLKALYERDSYVRYVLQWEHVRFFLLQFIPELLTHSRTQDVEQVRGHYDRGDDFYAAFLGETMIYTSGIFHDPEETLEQAQNNKLELVAQKIHLKEGDQHLDIGCGWGTLIAHFAKNYKTDSTGVTLGKNQTDWANNKAKAWGVADKARAWCIDYRDIPEASSKKQYDKITCLEMSEHVGVKYYSAFVKQVRDMLKDDGIFYLQIAGLRRPWQYEDLNWGLFMGKYIFPGADASCPLGWVIDQLEAGGFEIRSEETIGVHYSATIKRWYDNWLSNEAKITSKYGQRWYRLWMWFLAWSVISPEQGSASCYQIVAHKNHKAYDRKQWLGERKKWKI